MRHTPLLNECHALGGKVIDFHGWALPVQFAGILQEHQHTRTKVSLFDCSHMGEFLIRGADAIAAYDRLIISDTAKIPVGRARYGAMLTKDGGIIDDLVTMRLAGDELFVVVNAGPLDKVSAIITAAVSGAQDISAETAKIDIQGPLSRGVLLESGFEAASALKYFQATRTTWRGFDIVLSRTGYTGELGYEIFMPNAAAVPMWRALLEHQAVKPAGLGARDTLRTEMGYLLSGQDFDESRTPLEAGLDAFIAWNTEFTGKDALKAQQTRGGYPVITPIQTGDRRAPRHGFDIQHAGETVGVVTSGTFAPSLERGIGLAYLPQNLRQPGTRLTAGPRRLEIEVAELPFYTQGTCRN